MSEDGERATQELPQIWQFIHPRYGAEESDEEGASEDDDVDAGVVASANNSRAAALDYVKLSRKAPKLGRLLRYLNNMEEEEEMQQVVLERDPVTQQSLLQWASLNGHFMLVEYLVKRLHRAAFAFDPDSEDVVVYQRWEEMRPELPAAADVAERQKTREQQKARRAAERAAARAMEEDADSDGYGDGDEDEEGEEGEPMPEQLVYDTLEEYHEQWGDRGPDLVKRVGELGVYIGARLRDGTKEGLGQSLFPNGDCYAGQYWNNQREGKGVYWWAHSTTMYTGDWLRNMRHGHGRIAYPDGSRYLGHWRDDKKHGEGSYVYADGSRYTGTWIENEKHGHGRYDFPDGSSYVGTFCHNAFISGEWWLASGTVRYIGNFANDKPDGAGIFVHRCGLKQGTFQQEGTYRGGEWYPGTLKGSAKLLPRLEVAVAPGQGNARVPVEFDDTCVHGGMADLVRAVNYGPFQQWLRLLPGTGVGLKRVEVVAIGRDEESTSREHIAELRIRPHLVNLADGTRYRPALATANHADGVNGEDNEEDDDEVLVLREPSSRLLVLLHSGADAPVASNEPVVIVERTTADEKSNDNAASTETTRVRLPAVRLTAHGAAEGAFSSRIGPALRLSLNARTVCPLLTPEEGDPLRNKSTESVVLYAQQVHLDALATLDEKLKLVTASSNGTSTTSYAAIPLSELRMLAADAVTLAAITAAVRRREERTLPLSTVAPQRPPTPLPPAIEPRPELQPLYEAKAARAAAAAAEENDL